MPLLALASLCLLQGGQALKLEESLTRGDSVPRLALIKFPRTGSTLMMNQLANVACPTHDKSCRGLWVPEVFDQACPGSATCDKKRALALVKKYSSCENKEGCGWSLNLFKHQRSGLLFWEQIVQVMAAQPMTVVFLNRQDHVAQFVSYAVGTQRKALLRSQEFLSIFGPGVCNAYQYYNCPPEVVAWVDERTKIQLDLRQMHDEVLRSRREAKIYQNLEDELRKAAYPNLRILHITYEQLQQGDDAWRQIFEAVGHPEAPAPSMIFSNYSRFISNWPAVEAYSRATGGYSK